VKSFSISGKALLEEGIAEATIQVSGASIAAVTRGIDARADYSVAGWIAPGFIDLQINGGFGFDFTQNPDSVAKVAARLVSTGVTAFLPTLITSPLDSYVKLERDLERGARDAHGAQILGIHLEGPYLNRKRRGAHNPDYIRDPDVKELPLWAGSSMVRMATLAPELPGAIDMIRELVARGIIVSAGHSDADYAQAMSGIHAGVTWGTHLFNAMSPFTHREPGLVGTLLSSETPCGLIVDGVHVHAASVRTAFRAKGAQGITLVTDAMAAMGMAPGTFKLADRDVLVDETTARLLDGTLAGSILQMDSALRNVIEQTGCSLADGLAMASATPARVLGLERKGRIAPGCDADLVILDPSLHVEMTVACGKIVYTRGI
jgi:N-acetylglucosamine-6-phosphate deacetylase